MPTRLLKLTILLVFASIIVAFFTFDLSQYATLQQLKHQQITLQQYYHQHPVLALLVFGFVYIFVTAFSLPVATILTLLAGALFGFIPGLIVVSFASSIGATLACLMARLLLRSAVQQKYHDYLQKINQGIKREGAFYLFALRLVPTVPFFAVNLVMGVLPMPIRVFYLVSQIGMLPATAIYVYAGTELAEILPHLPILPPRHF